MGRSKNSSCDKCAYLIYHMEEKNMCCSLDKTYSNDCFTTEYQKYIQETKSISIGKSVTLYVEGRKKDVLIKEVRYIEQDVDTSWIGDAKQKENYIKTHNKRAIMYNIEIDGESLLYSFTCDIAQKCYLQGKRDNDWYGETIKIEITNYDYLLDLLWKSTEFSDYGLLSSFAPSRAR